MIHPTAIISDETQLWADVTIWPYVVLQGKNIVWDRAHIMAHARIADSEIGDETVLTPYAKIEKSVLGKKCKIWCELRKCKLGDRVVWSHTNIVLEWTTIDGYTNIASGVVFGIWWGAYDDDGWYIKATLHIWHNVFVGVNTVFYPGKDQKISIGNDVYVAWDLSVRHDIPDWHRIS